MADSVQVMNDWRRMCQAQDDGSDRDVCETCPMGTGGCSAIYEDDGSMDYAHVEKVVTKWAEEHPEPVYPTWGEWLCEQGVVVISPSPRYEEDFERLHYLTPVVRDTIPANIAQKLGIEPKEDT